jgi:hypothetical protein
MAYLIIYLVSTYLIIKKTTAYLPNLPIYLLNPTSHMYFLFLKLLLHHYDFLIMTIFDVQNENPHFFGHIPRL